VTAISNSTIDHNHAIGAQGIADGSGDDGLGGGLPNVLGSTLTASSCTLDHNQAVGGDGDEGGNGGNGLGGGIYNDGATDFGVSSLTITSSAISHNDADAGAGGAGGSAGQGVGGGLYLADGGIVCIDTPTVVNIKKNHASTSNNNIYGVFTTC
jgi:hypothetical protein